MPELHELTESATAVASLPSLPALAFKEPLFDAENLKPKARSPSAVSQVRTYEKIGIFGHCLITRLTRKEAAGSGLRRPATKARAPALKHRRPSLEGGSRYAPPHCGREFSKNHAHRLCTECIGQKPQPATSRNSTAGTAALRPCCRMPAWGRKNFQSKGE